MVDRKLYLLHEIYPRRIDLLLEYLSKECSTHFYAYNFNLPAPSCAQLLLGMTRA